MALTLTSQRRRVELKARARTEFLEMPGLRLTLPQASRLCAATSEDCECVFNELIADGFLCRMAECYVRTDRVRQRA